MPLRKWLSEECRNAKEYAVNVEMCGVYTCLCQMMEEMHIVVMTQELFHFGSPRPSICFFHLLRQCFHTVTE